METIVNSAAPRMDYAGAVAAEPAKPERIHLNYLDGLRGLAALYVVISHVTLECLWHGHDAGLGRLGRLVISASQCGRYAVALFIVLSGYCLMLPVARSEGQTLRGGTMEYLKRRSRRILPPYYAALILSIILVKLVPALHSDSGILANTALPALKSGPIISHLLLVHNLSNAWSVKINSPMWSVATEWQIYFFFPLLLLPLLRRFGALTAVIAGFALGVAPHLLHQFWLDGAAPWYLGLFALGMAAASINFPRTPGLERLRTAAPWGTIALALGAVLVAATMKLGYAKALDYLEIYASLPAVCLIIWLTEAARADKRPIVLQFLRLRAVEALGIFSYSLYLTHIMIVEMFHAWVAGIGVSSTVELLLELFVSVPLCVIFAYGFHLLFERRFMSSQKSAKQVA